MSKAEKSEKPQHNKMLNATQGLKNIMGRHFLAIEQAYRDGKPTAWATSGSPVEMLYAMEVQPMLPENSATVSAAQKYSQNFIEVAEAEGFSYDLCSYFKTNVGAVLSNAGMIEGGTRKPTFMLSTDVICDTHVNWFQVQAERMNVPHFTVDVPHVVSNSTNRQYNYFKKYITEQLYEFIDFMQEVTGNEYDEERARKVTENSWNLSEVWKNIYELRKEVPCPISTRDTFGGLFPLFTMPGLKAPIKLYKRMYNEAKERVDNGIGALEKEEFRLMFEGIPFWYNLKYFSQLEKWNAIIVYEPYTYAFSKYMNPKVTKEMVLNTPIEAMEKYLPLYIQKYSLRPRSGGHGQNKGGDGIIREYKFRVPTQISIISERRNFSPYGLEGGGEGKKGVNRLIRANGQKIKLGSKENLKANTGDILHIETPGGGGYGRKD